MLSHRKDDRIKIVMVIESYLNGQATAASVAAWATARMSDDGGPRQMEQMEDYIVADALGALMMLSLDEPEEYRTTREELLATRAYLLEETPFPRDRVPRRRRDG